MKKIRIILLFMAMLVLFSCIPSFAAETPPLTNEEARKLLLDAADLRTGIGFFFNWFDGSEEVAKGDPGYSYSWLYVYERVKDGYGPDDLKQKIRSTFSANIAEQIIANSSDFFKEYYQEDGKWYYGWWHSGGRTIAGVHGNNPWVVFDNEELKKVTVSKCEGTSAVAVVPAHRVFDVSCDESKARKDFEIEVYFAYDNGWKISGGDLSNMIFRADSTVDRTGKLNEQIVKECLIASVCDLYSYTRLENDERLTTYGDMLLTVYDKGRWKLEGNLSDVSTWENYIGDYCSGDVSNKLLVLGKSLKKTDGALCHDLHGYHQCGYGLGGFRQYDLAYLEKNTCKIENASDNKATVTYNFDGIGEAKIEFSKIDGKWKISGGDFIEVLDAYYFPPKTTGDTGITAAVITGAAALLLLAVLNVKRKSEI